MSTASKPTISDVAAHAGVSIATVSRVVNGGEEASVGVALETRRRVREAINDLGYVPSQAGRTLRRQTSNLVALLIPDITNAFYAAIAHSVELALRDLGYAMTLCNTDEDPELQDKYLQEMQEHQVHAVILLGAVESAGLEKAVKAGVRMAFLNRRAPTETRMPFVGIDNRAAGAAVARHFLAHRYDPIAVIHGPLGSSASRERYEGFEQALRANGVELAADCIEHGDLTIDSGYTAAERMLRTGRRPAAIFCGNDLMAYGAYRRCRDLQIRVPDDIALFGFDDNPMNDWLADWLSTVRVPYDRFGSATAGVIGRMLSAADEGPRETPEEILLPYQLVIRGSS
ncbi:LacI family DNA-binding transcriptional regulator [Aquisalimonas lutea]|uniref:LacI family DNA-binding transcriptional regulator n=1 Tax=Aquisalimonas lutea TaxID=1327750 RepID=UPI0025B328BD|nr:LacI family DNA-binding transcriptional regulator [Aquisalimonas lutea]MDN3516573.1 LacI family DNA-binding transcriptional regulator [Aquisalimonas lutea]